MRFVTCAFTSPEEFLASYSRDYPEGALYCRTRSELELDEDILVEVYFPGLANRTLVRGWVVSVERRRAVWVRLNAGDAHRRDFMVSLAKGDIAPGEQVSEAGIEFGGAGRGLGGDLLLPVGLVALVLGVEIGLPRRFLAGEFLHLGLERLDVLLQPGRIGLGAGESEDSGEETGFAYGVVEAAAFAGQLGFLRCAILAGGIALGGERHTGRVAGRSPALRSPSVRPTSWCRFWGVWPW